METCGGRAHKSPHGPATAASVLERRNATSEKPEVVGSMLVCQIAEMGTAKRGFRQKP